MAKAHLAISQDDTLALLAFAPAVFTVSSPQLCFCSKVFPRLRMAIDKYEPRSVYALLRLLGFSINCTRLLHTCRLPLKFAYCAYVLVELAFIYQTIVHRPQLTRIRSPIQANPPSLL